MSKPYHALLLLIMIAALYFAIASVLPQSNLRLGFADVQFPLPELNGERKHITGDTLLLVAQEQFDTASKRVSAHSDAMIRIPSNVLDSHLIKKNEESATLKKLGVSAVSIESDNPNSKLTNFIKSLKSLDNNNAVVRVLHFGDSQIEVDRVTSELRSSLQRSYGGKGIGLLPLSTTTPMPAGISVNYSNDWRYVSIMNAGRNKKSECLLGAFATLQPSASFRRVFDVRVRSYQLFTKLLILYGKADSSFTINIYADGTLIQQTDCSKTDGIAHISANLPSAFSKVQVEIKNPSQVNFYGLFAESNSGVSVCNIPIRGSSGNFFSSLDRDLASQLYEQLNIRLVILQFGINVVPANLSNYKYYEDLMSNQIVTLKQIAPKADILVVGVSDMVSRIDGLLQSYPSVELVLNAQRSAALRQGVNFWNGLSAMGGRGAIIDWVNASPALATKDYTHFTHRGAQLFGKALSESLLQYLSWSSTETQPESFITSDKGIAR